MKISGFAKKATALLSAIAASSFLGLPVLAQTNGSVGNRQSMTPCSPVSQSSSTTSSMSSSTAQADRSYNTAEVGSSYNYDRAGLNVAGGVNTSAPGVRDFPNQTDPRASAPGEFDSVNNTNRANASASMGVEVPVAYGQEPARLDQRASAAPDSRADAVIYGDVLSTGGSTTGGESRLIVDAASNPRTERQTYYRQSSYPASSNMSSMGSTGMNSSMSSTSRDATTPSNAATAGGEASQIVDRSAEMGDRTYTSGSYSGQGSQMQAADCAPNTQRNINYQQRDMSRPSSKTEMQAPAGTQSPSAPERTNFEGQPAPETDKEGTSQERSINYEQRNTGADSVEQRDMSRPSSKTEMQAPAGTQSPSAPERTNFEGQPAPERQ